MKPNAAEERRASLWPAAALVLLAALLPLVESFLPGKLLLPLLPGDFPAWSQGVAAEQVDHHPHPNWCMSDVLHLLVPGLAVNARAFARGELPLWDDGQALGLPHLAEVHYGVLYPPAWLPVALGLRGLAWMALVHLLAAGWGMLLYLRAIGRSRGAAILGALAFMLSAWVTARLQSFPVVGAIVWLPLVAWGCERAARADATAATATDPRGRGRARASARRHRVAVALGTGLAWLAGFPQVAFWATATAAWLELVRPFGARRSGQPVLRPLLGNGVALVLGLGLALPQLLPTLDTLAHDSLRRPQDAAAVAGQGLEPPMLWGLLAADREATTSLAGAHPLALSDLEQARQPAAVNRAEVSMGIGVLGLLLALVALVHGRNWRTLALGALTAAVFGLLLWPGALRLAAEWLPPLRQGNPKRLLAIATFALAVLAAGGLDLVRGRRMKVTVTAWALSVAVTLAAVVARLSVPSTDLPEDVDAWASRLAADLSARTGQPLDADALLALVPRENFVTAGRAAALSCLVAIAVGAFALIVFRPRRLPTQAGWTTLARARPALLAWAVALELLVSAWPMLRAAPAEQATLDPDRLSALLEPPVAELARGAGAEPPVPVRLARLGNDPSWLRPNFPSLFGLSDLQCYAPMAPRRVAELLAALDPGVVVSGSALGGFAGAAQLASPLLDLLDVRVVLTDRDDLATPEAPLPGWSEQGRVGTLRVLRNDEALPRAFVPARLELVPDEAARVERLVAPDFDPRRLALLEAPPPADLPPAAAAAVASRLADAPGPGEREVIVTGWRAGRIELRVEPGPPGLLVISEGFHPGWSGTVDGRPLPLLRADHALLAIPVASAETAKVLLQFDPPLVKSALLAGAAVAAILLLALAWPARARA